MSEAVEGKGKTVSEAVSEALLHLGLRRDEVDITVLQEPKAGLLGFIGSRPAKVSVAKKSTHRRGRGRDHSDDQHAHSLGRGGNGGRGGRSRGGRGRGGRDQKAADGERNDRQENGRPVNARQSGKRQEGNRQEGNRQEGNRREGNRQGGGRKNNGRQDGGRQDANRQEGRRQERNHQENRDQKNGRHDGGSHGSRRRGSRTDGPTEPRPEARGSGRSRRNQSGQQSVNTPTVSQQPSAPDTSRPSPVERVGVGIVRQEATSATENSPRRKSRGGRGIGGPSRAKSKSDSEKVNLSPVKRAVNERGNMAQNEKKPVVPAAEIVKEAPAAAVADTPKVKRPRGGRGGGLGSRLSRSNNPNVKAKKPAPIVSASAAPSAELRTSASSGSVSARTDDRDWRSSAPVDEVIAHGIAASRYAKAIAGVNEETMDDALRDLTSGMLARAGFSCEVEVKPGDYREVRISSDDDDSAGLIIGRHGQMVDAVEHLVERMASNAIDDRVRMNLDINQYRGRREADLASQVAEAISGVRESGKPYHMDSMSARERRLVHLEAEGVSGIRTYTVVGSRGKHVVISQDDDSDSAGQSGD